MSTTPSFVIVVVSAAVAFGVTAATGTITRDGVPVPQPVSVEPTCPARPSGPHRPARPVDPRIWEERHAP